MTVPSPCTNVCAIDPKTGFCAGCLRTIDEIAGWGGGDDRWKQAVLDALPERRKRQKAS
jgi:predicted Fe-S protein YdhL (DUF1289 family)